MPPPFIETPASVSEKEMNAAVLLPCVRTPAPNAAFVSSPQSSACIAQKFVATPCHLTPGVARLIAMFSGTPCCVNRFADDSGSPAESTYPTPRRGDGILYSVSNFVRLHET